MNLSRNIQPPLTETPVPVMPEVIQVKLDNGIPVFLIESGTEDILRLDFTFRAGQINEDSPVLALATNLMLREGTEKYPAVELNRLIDYHGSFINLYTEKDIAGLLMYLLNKHLSKMLELCREMLFMPGFPDEELSVVMKKQLRWFQIRKQKVQNLAMDRFFGAIFGESHPYGRKPSEDDFEKMESSRLRDFHSQFYIPANMAIIASGKIPGNIAETLNTFFGDIPTGKFKKNNPATYRSEAERRAHVSLDGVMQNSIKIGSPTINKNDPGYRDLKIADTILGGYFGSRLMKNIREDKGYTYGINSYVTSLEESGYKVISTDVGSENTQKAIDEILKEIKLLQTVPVDASEIAIAKNYMCGELVRMFDGPFASADSFKSAWEFGLDNNYYAEFYRRIRAITPEEIIDTASRYFKIDDLYTITAGTL